MKSSSCTCLVTAILACSSLSSGFGVVAPGKTASTVAKGAASSSSSVSLPTTTTTTTTLKLRHADSHLLESQSEGSDTPTPCFPKTRFAASQWMLGSMLLFSSVGIIALPQPAVAEGSTVVGKLQGSGLVFKDTLQIQRFEDPKIKGVELYISNFDRPITEKLSGANLFNDPAYASVACAKTAKVVAIADTIAKGPGGEEVFEESRSLLFKTLRVQRIYDTETNTVVYVSFNTRLDKNDDTNKSRFKSSLCAVNLNDS